MARSESGRRGAAYADPYLAGIGLGLVLVAAFLFLGRGVGASGGFAFAAAKTASAVDSAGAASNPWFERYRAGASGWLLVELAGIALGGFVSARLAGRSRLMVERGPAAPLGARLAGAFAGGAVMGLGAVLARGCTSGQALTGGALLSVGGWIFLASAFLAAYAVTPLVRSVWR